MQMQGKLGQTAETFYGEADLGAKRTALQLQQGRMHAKCSTSVQMLR
jgi:hypothetical protein